MVNDIPDWALRPAEQKDRDLIPEAERLGTLRINWPDKKILRKWAKDRGWPAPWFGFQKAFIGKMLESGANFELAAGESGIGIFIPRSEVEIPADKIREFDDLYKDPADWDILVGELRELRRAAEAGVCLKFADGRTIRTWGEFYSWAHGRYHMLEDGCDRWIGNDD